MKVREIIDSQIKQELEIFFPATKSVELRVFRSYLNSQYEYYRLLYLHTYTNGEAKVRDASIDLSGIAPELIKNEILEAFQKPILDIEDFDVIN